VKPVAERDNAPVCKCYQVPRAMDRVIKAPMIAVFTPYRTVAVDKDSGKTMQIRSKAEHEAFLRRNGYEEVGNDPSMKPVSKEEDAERRQRWADEPTAPMVDVEKLKREGFIQEDLTA
jgi:hypothetical protein